MTHEIHNFKQAILLIKETAFFHTNHIMKHFFFLTGFAILIMDFEKYTMLCRQLQFANVLEVRTASIFWVEEYAKQPSSWVLFGLEAIER
jgi:hypothetical protein